VEVHDKIKRTIISGYSSSYSVWILFPSVLQKWKLRSTAILTFIIWALSHSWFLALSFYFLQFSASGLPPPPLSILFPYLVCQLVNYFPQVVDSPSVNPSLEVQGLILGLPSPQTGSFHHGWVLSTRFFGIVDRGPLPLTDSRPAEPENFNEVWSFPSHLPTGLGTCFGGVTVPKTILPLSFR
jgi:hypothetical protein